MQLKNHNILLGITGGIAAYKAPDLVRKLTAKGADVRVVLTDSATEFVSPLALQAVSGNPVSDDLLDRNAEAAMGHIELARWADALLIAPATANTIAKLAAGLADDLLTTLCLATRAPITLAPAMNQQMWHAAATQENLDKLRQRNVTLFGPDEGEQACGDVGPGRMLEPQQIADMLEQALLSKDSQQILSGSLRGKRLLLTAGPTREAIDPVRYLSNHSSGKMGFALASAAHQAGAEVTLVSGPVGLPTPEGVTRIDVSSAAQMHQAVMENLEDTDIFIGCAAVADYRPERADQQKIKKNEEKLTLTFVKNPDILSDVAAAETPPFTVGFAAETQQVRQYAREKLTRKRIDMIAANDVSDPSIGFNSDDNALTVFWHDGEKSLQRADKNQLASQLVALIAERFSSR